MEQATMPGPVDPLVEYIHVTEVFDDAKRFSTEGMSLIELANREIDWGQVLITDEHGRVRYLERGGSLVYGGPSGIGKSTIGTIQDACWACGRSAFGLHPTRPLRILCLQAENTVNDATAVVTGVVPHLGLTDEESELVRQNTCYRLTSSDDSQSFLATTDELCRQFRADILRIDPLLAFCGGDLTKPEIIAAFCRKGLNGIASRRECAVIVAHHTPKTTNRDTTKWGTYDWQYALAGSADLPNWMRAGLVIEPTGTDGLFKFIAAKRWPGWRDDQGEKAHVQYYRHSKNTLLWKPADPVEVQKLRRADATDVLALVPEDGGIGKNSLISRCQEELKLGENKVRRYINELLETERVFEDGVPRPGTRPRKIITRQRPEVVVPNEEPSDEEETGS